MRQAAVHSSLPQTAHAHIIVHGWPDERRPRISTLGEREREGKNGKGAPPAFMTAATAPAHRATRAASGNRGAWSCMADTQQQEPPARHATPRCQSAGGGAGGAASRIGSTVVVYSAPATDIDSANTCERECSGRERAYRRRGACSRRVCVLIEIERGGRQHTISATAASLGRRCRARVAPRTTRLSPARPRGLLLLTMPPRLHWAMV